MGQNKQRAIFIGVFPVASSLLFAGVFDGHKSLLRGASFKSDYPARIHPF